MNTKHRAYALTEMLVIIVMVAVLMGLSVRPFRTMISEIPRSARVCQTLNGAAKALDQLKNDIERASRITGLKDGILTLEHSGGPVSYTFAEGQITRRPAMNDSDTECIWQIPYLKTEARLWNRNDQPYAIELTTWIQQKGFGNDPVRFKQSTVFFKKAQPR
jgi:type II secretory pathway component PulJ